MALYYLPQYRSTTLNVAGGITDADTTGITLQSTPADIDITKAGIICINYADPLDTDVAEFITYSSIDGSGVLQGVTRGCEGFGAKAHDNGATIAWVVSKSHINNVNDLLTGEATGAVLDTPSVSNLTITSGDLALATGLNIQVNSADPKRAIYIPANGIYTATTSGAAYGTNESTTNKINYISYDFDTAADEYAWFSIPAPAYWDLGTVTAQFHWTAASSTGTVCFALAGLARSNDDAIDTALGTAVAVTDTLIATGDVHITDATAAITIGGTPAKSDYLYFRVIRDVSEDTLGADAKLLGVTIRFGVSQYSDE